MAPRQENRKRAHSPAAANPKQKAARVGKNISPSATAVQQQGILYITKSTLVNLFKDVAQGEETVGNKGLLDFILSSESY